MAASVVQVVHNENGGSGTSIAVVINGVTLNNGLVALVTCADGVNVSSVSDGTTTFNPDENRDATNEGQQFSVASLANSPSGTRTITATFSGNSFCCRGIQVLEVSGVQSAASGTGLKLSGTPAGNDSGAGTASSFDSAAASKVTTVDNGALVIAYGEGNTNQPTVAGAYTLGADDTVNLFTSEYQIQGSAGAINPSFTMAAADKWAVVIAAYAPVTAAPPTEDQSVGYALRPAAYLSKFRRSIFSALSIQSDPYVPPIGPDDQDSGISLRMRGLVKAYNRRSMWMNMAMNPAADPFIPAVVDSNTHTSISLQQRGLVKRLSNRAMTRSFFNPMSGIASAPVVTTSQVDDLRAPFIFWGNSWFK